MFENILFVCVGNICRSPVAEALLKTHFKSLHQSHQVASCGIGALVDEPAADFSIQVLSEKDIDISQHRAKQITSDMVVNADLILTMEEDHVKDIQAQFPFAVGKVHLLGKWRNEEILDPYKKGRPAFETMLKHIELTMDDWIKKFW